MIDISRLVPYASSINHLVSVETEAVVELAPVLNEAEVKESILRLERAK